MNQITPSFEEIPPPPAAIEVPAANDKATHAALLVVLTANIAMAVLIMAAMLLNGRQLLAAIVAGTIYFLSATVTFTFIITGSLSAIVGVWSRERTERRRIDAYQNLGEMMIEWRMMQEVGLTDRRGSTDGVRRLSPLGDSPNYVTPYLDGQQAAVDAMRFAVSLYGADGRPDRKKVQADGRLAVRMIGSKRGGGSRESGVWLLRQGVIVRVRKGYALDLLRYPTVSEVRRLL